MKNLTKQDAFERVVDARMGSLVNATDEFLIELEAQVLRWAGSLRRELAARSEKARRAEHSADDDCASTLDDDGNCTVCGVSAGDPCPACGGVRYHHPECQPLARERARNGHQLLGVAIVEQAHRLGYPPGTDLTTGRIPCRNQIVEDGLPRPSVTVVSEWVGTSHRLPPAPHVKAVNGDHVAPHTCAAGPADPSCCATCGGRL